MIRIGQIKLEINENTTYEDKSLKEILQKKAAKKLKVSASDIVRLDIVKHSIDARKKPELFDVYVVEVSLKGNEGKLVSRLKDRNITLSDRKEYDFWIAAGVPEISSDKKVVIIGSGPAGLFCGYELARHGFKPLILERGSDVDKRTEIVSQFWKDGKLNPATNVQFGEGGAGTFSDGKLNTMVKDKDGRGERALDIFVKAGAPERIKYESKPHIGTDILRRVVKNIRNEIISSGGQVMFDSQVTDIVIDDGRVKAVKCGETEYPCDYLVLAIGHSARDTFAMLKDRGISMQPKPFAVGFRVEHPQSLINESQYGKRAIGALPPAPYKLTTTTSEGRGVYSFCMCPGGYVVNASSEEDMLAVNGMSYSGRDGDNANSAIIITVDPKDFGGSDILSGVEFQRRLEKKAYELAGGKIPVEYYGDFKKAIDGDGQESGSIDNFIDQNFVPQMKGEYEFAKVHTILPDDLNKAFVEGMENFGRTIRGYNDDRALVSGVESRTSSPVRIVRLEDGVSENISGLFPCGEGAGYAGGIMSAAMDGIRIAQLVARKAGGID
ncbi:FAD-binding protein [Butyrivibrio sp. CB08]|uniref:NAD(P)/FAD-dependent oxidoreductase n=1 Tax=Butyrivibrio sp. CB08 TaxID=2364879 RepID=UPI000EA9AA66|nr:FAD-dependent oxidoreductase [Butyrivibrio sp. CB08]RKM62374.1 FAD-binding protein [Butyrivibrio sp. CB08]